MEEGGNEVNGVNGVNGALPPAITTPPQWEVMMEPMKAENVKDEMEGGPKGNGVIMSDSDLQGQDGILVLVPPKEEVAMAVDDVIIIEDDSASGPLKRKLGDPNPIPHNVPYMQQTFCFRETKYTYTKKCFDCHEKVKVKKTLEGVEDQHEQPVVQKDDVCRFLHFRKLIKKSHPTKKGYFVQIAGFLHPETDVLESDELVWMPNPAEAPEELELSVCLKLITELGDQICSLLRSELEAPEIEASLHKAGKEDVAWKRPVAGVREMCDVCATTVFNYHWICKECGFVACLDCFKAKVDAAKTKEKYVWHACVHGSFHTPEKMVLAQILPKQCLANFLKLVHVVRRKWQIEQTCQQRGCKEVEKYKHLKVLDDSKAKEKGKDAVKDAKTEENGDKNDNDGEEDPFDFDIPPETEEAKTEEKAQSDEEDPFDIDIPPECNENGNDDASKTEKEEDPFDITIPPQENNVTKEEEDKENGIRRKRQGQDQPVATVAHFVRSADNTSIFKRKEPPLGNFLYSETILMYPGLPHQWLCNGSLLRLTDPDHDLNLPLFQTVWQLGQPVIVSNVGSKLTKEMWSPSAFMRDFGIERYKLIDYLTDEVRDMTLREFWEGFMDSGKRPVGNTGEPALFKLKDWPSNHDFASVCPKRFDDLMRALPLKQYTQREGKLNLAARLPKKSFMPPDLGPKMYIAYGDGENLEKGTTVLHLDISDAVNLMVHVEIPENCRDEHKEAVRKAIEESDCDRKMIKRALKGDKLPGALWHIYRPWDADKIRDLLNKVDLENNVRIDVTNDPIHDQTKYLDKELRMRLWKEYDVIGFPIVQCEGDAVFIPAGAPHQVRNLHNCIKIAEDYVSPENVSHCFQLTDEFRKLSESHSNHEDKLQIKNIVFHAMKDAMSVLLKNSDLSVEDLLAEG